MNIAAMNLYGNNSVVWMPSYISHQPKLSLFLHFLTLPSLYGYKTTNQLPFHIILSS